jgi:hypothetical protein
VGNYIDAAVNIINVVAGKTTDSLTKVFPGPYEYTAIVLAFALAFRKTKQEIISLYDTAHGSIIESNLSASFLSFGGGTISFEFIDQSPARIVVKSIAEIEGQDWGKGKQTLEEIFESGADYVRKMTG